MNFKSDIQKYIQQQKRVFGKISRPRIMDPPMLKFIIRKQILSWDDFHMEPTDFKKITTVNQNPIKIYNQMINKSIDNWISQYNDQFKGYYKLNKSLDLININQETLKKIKEIIPKEHIPVILSDEQTKQKQYKQLSVNQITEKIQSNAQTKTKQIKRPIYDKLYLQKNNEPIEIKIQAKEKTPQTEKEKSKKSQRKKAKNQKISIIQKKLQKVNPNQPNQQYYLRQQRIKKFKQQSRQLPNTSSLTYFGKPPFQAYGRQNLRPVSGGIVYGDYMLTHNVSPHRGRSPKFIQTYKKALLSAYPVTNQLPRKKRFNEQQIECKLSNSRIFPQMNQNKDEFIRLQAPDLLNTYTFASDTELKQKARKIQGRFSNIEQNRMKAVKNRIEKKEKKNLRKSEKKTDITPISKIVKKKQKQPKIQQQKVKQKEIKINQQIKKKQKEKKKQIIIKIDQRPNNFMQQYLKMKEHQKRIALKVTQVILKPNLQYQLKNIKIPIQQKKQVQKQQLNYSNQIFKDPKNYIDIPYKWLEGIPAAGIRSNQLKQTKQPILI